jgi:UDP-N-acetylmuramate dehydrogenase
MNGVATEAVEAAAAHLRQELGGKVTRDAPSAGLTTYRCGGPLAVLVRAETEGDLFAVADALAADAPVDVLVVGRGSNLLVADAGFPGVAVVLAGDFERLTLDAPSALAEAGGAVPLPVLARRSAAAGVRGLEFFVGIPGSVGGAVRMNAGGHGSETRDVLCAARVCDLDRAEMRDADLDGLSLGYRTSALGAREVVTAARFAGARDDPDACGRRIDEIVRWRREHQPGGQNAGSVFTNPEGDAAGRLIDQCGLKGLRIGGAVVSDKHANFFVAEPGARAADVRALVVEVQRRVEAATGVRLEPELRFVGFAEGGGEGPE